MAIVDLDFAVRGTGCEARAVGVEGAGFDDIAMGGGQECKSFLRWWCNFSTWRHVCSECGTSLSEG